MNAFALTTFLVGDTTDEKAPKIGAYDIACRFPGALSARWLVLANAVVNTLAGAVAPRRSSRPVTNPTLDIAGPEVQGFERASAHCRCEKDAVCVALYRHREEGAVLVSDTEDALRAEGLRLYNGVPRAERKEWLTKNDPRAAAVRRYFALLNYVSYVEEACEATSHYTLVTEPGPYTSLDPEKAFENGDQDERAEFFRHRAPLLSSRSHDPDRGYVEHPRWRANAEREQREAATEARLYARLDRLHAEGKPAHPWLSPARGTGHGKATNATVIRHGGEIVRRTYHSTFFQMQQRDRALKAQHAQKRRIAALAEACGMSIRDDRVRARIAELGLDAAEAALQVRALEAGVAI